MDIQSRKDCLAQIDLFQSFSDKELSTFAENVIEVNFAEGESIFAEGDHGSNMYILLDGSIKIYKNNRYITTITPVDYLGEMSIIEKKPRSATATALTPSHLLEISQQLFKDYLSSQPLSLVSMMKTLSMRIRSDTELIAQEFQKANILIHDMRNRLSSFLLIDLIDDDTLSTESKRFLQIMKESSHDLSEMMNEAMANAKSLKYNQLPIETSINKLILELHNSEFRIHESLQNINIHLDLAPEIRNFNFYPIDVRRVITNLTINAGQASSEHGDIHISTIEKEGFVEVSIKDQGNGIPANIQARIFEPNFTTKSYGNGLGLASCKEIIENKHHGQLSFESSDKGTNFLFTLPLDL
jgi:signal transduction histidine kinase